MDDDETMEDEFLDCTGKKRWFRLQSYAGGMFLDATELLDDQAVGMRFVMRAGVDGVLPWGEMRAKLRARMAERDVAMDPDTGRLEILRGLVRAQIHSVPQPDDEDEHGPVLIVDDRKITWHELGEMLVGLEGWSLRVEILDHDRA
jgi:hypothetical protein